MIFCEECRHSHEANHSSQSSTRCFYFLYTTCSHFLAPRQHGLEGVHRRADEGKARLQLISHTNCATTAATNPCRARATTVAATTSPRCAAAAPTAADQVPVPGIPGGRKDGEVGNLLDAERSGANTLRDGSVPNPTTETAQLRELKPRYDWCKDGRNRDTFAGMLEREAGESDGTFCAAHRTVQSLDQETQCAPFCTSSDP
jgi:hypothetical protein